MKERLIVQSNVEGKYDTILLLHIFLQKTTELPLLFTIYNSLAFPGIQNNLLEVFIVKRLLFIKQTMF